MSPAALFETLTAAYGGEEDGIRAIFEYCLDRLEQGELDAISTLMCALEVERLAVSVMLAPLSITVPCASYIQRRGVYYENVRRELLKRGVAEIEGLLVGLDQEPL